MTKLLDKFFPKKYRVVSSVTGPGEGWPYRSKWHAAFDAAKFEYTEWRVGLPYQKWSVEEAGWK